MVKYNVTLIDPPGYKYAYLITDVCRVIAYGLRSLGFTCDLTTNHLDLGCINILLAVHLLNAADAQTIASSGAKYIVHQSELLRPGTGEHKVVSAFLGEEFEARSRLLLEHAMEVWEPYAPNADLLALFDIPRERIKSFLAGYQPELTDVVHRPWAEKDIDVLFIGSVTPRRNQILSELSRHMKVHAALDAPAAFRNDMIGSAKINLNLRANDNSTMLEAGRVTYLFNNRCVVVSEAAESHPHLHPLMVNAPYDQLVDTCRQLLAEGPDKLDQVAEAGFEGYKQFPMTDQLKRILDL